MLKVDDLHKSYEGSRGRAGRKGSSDDSATPRVFAVNNVSFEVQDGELFTLLGPSGCGKTTTLRCVAGLERPDSGFIALEDRPLFEARPGKAPVNVRANARGLGMVFQSYAIWPHMTVFDNVAFPLKVRPRKVRPGRAEIKRRVEKVLETMQLDGYGDRQATKLSGGQQQRLALARAIVIEPPLMLLDEPLSNLDAKLRELLRYELKRLQRELGITSIYVTHDQVEALALSSRIAVMDSGSVAQLGKPRQIYQSPQTKFVAEFIGSSNFLPASVVSRSEGEVMVATENGTLRLASVLPVQVGEKVMVSVRPESIDMTTTRVADTLNQWEGTVTARAFLGDAVDHMVRVGQSELRIRCNPSISVEPGTSVYLQVAASRAALVPVD